MQTEKNYSHEINFLKNEMLTLAKRITFIEKKIGLEKETRKDKSELVLEFCGWLKDSRTTEEIINDIYFTRR